MRNPAGHSVVSLRTACYSHTGVDGCGPSSFCYDLNREMDSPLSSDLVDDADRELVTRAQSGDRQALEELIARHQPWIYNIALRMLYIAENAEDATQDILIDMMTGIRTFRGESKFRTWLYRLATNRILNFKKKWAAAEPAYTFEWFAGDLDTTGLADIPDPRTVPVPVEVLIDEAKLSCTAAILLCLEGRQRLVYTLGEIFGVSDSVGAEVVSITPANFRQILARARRDLYSFLGGEMRPDRRVESVPLPKKDPRLHGAWLSEAGQAAVRSETLPQSPRGRLQPRRRIARGLTPALCRVVPGASLRRAAAGAGAKGVGERIAESAGLAARVVTLQPWRLSQGSPAG